MVKLNRTKRATTSMIQPGVTVESINRVIWNDFISNMFRIGVDTVINGSLTISTISPNKIYNNNNENLKYY